MQIVSTGENLRVLKFKSSYKCFWDPCSWRNISIHLYQGLIAYLYARHCICYNDIWLLVTSFKLTIMIFEMVNLSCKLQL